jgi:hypothetical protein
MRGAILLVVIAGLALGCAREPPAAPAPRPEKPRPAAAPATSQPAQPQPAAPQPATPQPGPVATTPPRDVEALMARQRQLNGRCRGGSGDDPATTRACDERDAVMKQIAARGWCWGRADQIEAEKRWERCAAPGQ